MGEVTREANSYRKWRFLNQKAQESFSKFQDEIEEEQKQLRYDLRFIKPTKIQASPRG